MDTLQKTKELAEISQEIKQFKGLEIAKAATNAVPGEGNPDSNILFIGEAPGFNEDRTGRPFVGQAGKLLEKSLSEINLNRADVYITNIVKFRPPENRDPLPDEIESCSGWLDRQISIIQPKIIVTLGRFSMAKFIPGVTISGVHGSPRFVDFQGVRYTVLPMYHPAAALRSPAVLSLFKQDFQKLAQLITPPPPQKAKPLEPEQSSLF